MPQYLDPEHRHKRAAQVKKADPRLLWLTVVLVVAVVVTTLADWRGNAHDAAASVSPSAQWPNEYLVPPLRTF